jgi:hypothetical protein
MAVPVNKKLYENVKAEAKKKFNVWPSAYASGWLVKTYKARGGTYKEQEDERSVNTVKKQSQKSLARWYDEKWVDVCRYLETGKLASCGRRSTRQSATSTSRDEKYPYCRPSIRISDKTPKTLDEISRVELERRCRVKRVGKSQVRVA